MAGSGQSGVMSSWGKRIVAVLGLGAALATWSCSSSSPAPSGPIEIPPPLNQPCNSDVDCGDSGLKCDPLRGCLPCVFDWHCAKGERCTDDGCKVPSPCTGDASCSDKPKAPHCDPVLGECVGCRDEHDCPEKSHCVERSCVSYTPCVNSRDCAEGTVCDRVGGECVECLGNGDCEKDKEVCVASHCVPVCASDKDCADRNQLCHHEKGYCADCVEQEDCPSIYYCANDRCMLDICKPGESACQGSNGYRTCNATGSGYQNDFCPLSSSCMDNSGRAVCKPWICTPGTTDCDAEGLRARQCASDGLSYASEVDCAAAGKQCYLSECRPKACEPGSQFCQGSELRECVANGTDSILKLACGAGQYCDSTALACVNQKCSPSTPLCDGNRATQCDSFGAGPVAGGPDCAADDKVCYEGECRKVICDGAFCQDGNVWSCLEAGTVTKLTTTCAANNYCYKGNCYLDNCTANQAVCNGNEATTCKADGSGAEPGGVDCAATDAVCLKGACVPKVCTPSTYFCSGGNPQLCNSNGTAFTQQSTCSASYFCKPGSAYCLSDVCTAGQAVCDGTIATTCNADGSGPMAGGTDCASSDKVCYLGSCLPKICNPSQYFCQGGNSYSCGSTGATSTLSDTCLPSEYCKPGTYLCQPDVCSAGTPTCNGANVSTCAADGSGPADGGTACSTGNTCYAGACKPVICTPDALQCTGNAIQRCVNAGTAWSTIQNCDGYTYCNELASPIACSADICTASAAACNGEKLATCAADGGHFSATSTDCAASNAVCSLTGSCVAEATDTAGDGSSATQVYTSLVGNVYRVDRARTLTKIEEYLAVTGTSAFTWVVYESTSYTGTFSKVFEKTTTDSGAGGFISSGALSVPLAAGKFYLFGVIVQGYYYRYANVSSAAIPFVSFGQLWNGTQLSYSSAVASMDVSASSVRLYQRISTAR